MGEAGALRSSEPDPLSQPGLAAEDSAPMALRSVREPTGSVASDADYSAELDTAQTMSAFPDSPHEASHEAVFERSGVNCGASPALFYKGLLLVFVFWAGSWWSSDHTPGDDHEQAGYGNVQPHARTTTP